MSTINSNTDPGAPTDLVDLVGELEQPPAPEPAPKRRTAKKK